MRSKLIIALALVLLASSTAVMAQLVQANITDSSFLIPPKAVIDTSQSSDSLFANATKNSIFFAPGVSNDTVYAYSYNYSNESSNLLLIKRAIDASTLKAKGNDVTINIPIKSKSGVSVQTDIGYISFVYMRDDGNGTADQLYFSALPLSADSNTQLTANDVKLTNNTSLNSTFIDGLAWLQDGYFIIPFLEIDISDGFEKAIYLQAVKASDGSLLFPSAVKVASFNNPPGTTVPTAGANKHTNASSIYIVYRVNDTRTIFQNSMSFPNGKVDEPTTLVSDNDTITYIPDGIIAANTVFGIVLKRLKTQQNQTSVDSLIAYYNGTTSKPQTLDVTIPQDISDVAIQAYNYKSGFILLTQFIKGNDTNYDMQIFNSDGSQQVAQKTLAYASVITPMVFFIDASGVLWLGYSDYDKSSDKVSKAYLGKVLE